MKTILSTKKLKLNQRELLLNAGVSFVEYDAIEIQMLSFKVPSPVKNAIITSQNGVKALLREGVQPHTIKNCFCVGDKTTQLLKENGFNVIETAQNGYNLAKKIKTNYNEDIFYYFCSKQRRDELPLILKIAKIPCNEIIVYETHLIEKRFKQKFDAILFFSPSGVTSFIKANYPIELTDERKKVEKLENDLYREKGYKRLATGNIVDSRAICIGNTTAGAASSYFYSCFTANTPTVESMIAKAVKVLNTEHPL